MKRRRWLSVLVLLLVCGVAGLRWYLQSSVLAEQVRARLAQLLNAPIELAGIDAGLSGTTLHGLQLREATPQGNNRPWLQADQVATDVSLWDVLAGNTTPKKVSVTGASLVLRLDESGKLLTQFPKLDYTKAGAGTSLPVIVLSKCQVILQKPGYHDLAVTIPHGQINTDDGQITLTAAAEHAQWGQWAIDGGFDKDTQELKLILTSQSEVAVSQAMLEALPFVPASIWSQVKLNGRAAGEIALRFDMAKQALHYRIDLNSRQTRVAVPALALILPEVSGRTILEDGVISLIGVKAEAFGGHLDTEATLDFRDPASRFDFRLLNVQGIDVTRLPGAWGWPRLIEGRLAAKAQVDITLDNGPAKIIATGQGELLGARIAGQPVTEPVKLLLDRELDVDLHLEEAELPTLLRGLGVTVPLETSGKVSLYLQASIPIHELGDRRKYRAVGKLDSASLKAGPLTLEQVQTDLTLDEGKLQFQGLSCFLASVQSTPAAAKGKLSGSATLDLVGTDELSAALRLEHAPAEIVTKLLPVEAKLHGLVSAEAKLRVPVSVAHRIEAWHADAQISAGQLAVADVALHDFNSEVSLDKGELLFRHLRARSDIGMVAAKGSCRLMGACPFQAKVALDDGDLEKIPAAHVPAQVAALNLHGKGKVSAELDGTLAPLRIKTRGLADLGSVQVRKVPFSQVRFAWSSDGARIVATNLEALGPLGEIRGLVDVNLDSAQDSQFNLKVTRLDLPALQQTLGSISTGIQGKVDGSVAILLEGAPPGLNRLAKLDLDLTSRSATIHGVGVERLQGQAILDSNILDYDLKGNSWGGFFAAKGRWPLAPSNTMIVNSGGKLTLRGVLLSRLAEVQPDFALPGLQGRADGFLVYQHVPDGKITGDGRLEILDVGLDSGKLLGDVRTEVKITPGEIRLHDISGDVARGLLNGNIALPLVGKRQGQFLLTLQGADASELLDNYLQPGLVQGPLSLRLTGQFGRAGWGSGHVMLQRGKVHGIDVSEWLAPFRWQWSPKQQRLVVDISESQAQVANGRATGSATVVWNDTLQIKGHCNYLGLHLRSLLQQFSGSIWGNGQTSGRCDFSGDNVRSFADMKIILDGQIKQMQAKSAPVVGQVAQALSLSGSLMVHNGDYHCRIDKGLLRVQKLALDMGKAQLFMEGTVSAAGHLQLDVTADTGGLLDRQILKGLGAGKSGTGVLPFNVLAQARAYLSKRLLAAHVTGTIRQPVVQIRPAPILTEDALRFFMNAGQ